MLQVSCSLLTLRAFLSLFNIWLTILYLDVQLTSDRQTFTFLLTFSGKCFSSTEDGREAMENSD